MAHRVLIVDDALFMRTMLRDIFVLGGFEVAGEASDGAEAVRIYRALRPDLVTMDLVMPNKSGIEALVEICAEDPDACIVMCSALGQEDLVRKAVQAGATDYIVKPFRQERVLDVAKRALSKGEG